MSNVTHLQNHLTVQEIAGQYAVQEMKKRSPKADILTFGRPDLKVVYNYQDPIGEEDTAFEDAFFMYHGNHWLPEQYDYLDKRELLVSSLFTHYVKEEIWADEIYPVLEEQYDLLTPTIPVPYLDDDGDTQGMIVWIPKTDSHRRYFAILQGCLNQMPLGKLYWFYSSDINIPIYEHTEAYQAEWQFSQFIKDLYLEAIA